MNLKKITVYLDEYNAPYIETEETSAYVNESSMHDSPLKVFDMLKQLKFDRIAKECVNMFLFDSANHLLSFTEISSGSIDRAFLSKREIAQTALLGGATSVILSHNHPSGECSPSDFDIVGTKNVKEALDFVGIKLLDHIIIGKDNYFSMRENEII